MSIRDFFQKH